MNTEAQQYLTTLAERLEEAAKAAGLETRLEATAAPTVQVRVPGAKEWRDLRLFWTERSRSGCWLQVERLLGDKNGGYGRWESRTVRVKVPTNEADSVPSAETLKKLTKHLPALHEGLQQAFAALQRQSAARDEAQALTARLFEAGLYAERTVPDWEGKPRQEGYGVPHDEPAPTSDTRPASWAFKAVSPASPGQHVWAVEVELKTDRWTEFRFWLDFRISEYPDPRSCVPLVKATILRAQQFLAVPTGVTLNLPTR